MYAIFEYTIDKSWLFDWKFSREKQRRSSFFFFFFFLPFFRLVRGQFVAALIIQGTLENYLWCSQARTVSRFCGQIISTNLKIMHVWWLYGFWFLLSLTPTHGSWSHAAQSSVAIRSKVHMLTKVSIAKFTRV